jgi:hypothetical protein
VHIDGPAVDASRSRLDLVAGQPTTVRCVVVSGLPPPVVDLFIDQLNVSGQFDLVRHHRPRNGTSVSSFLPPPRHHRQHHQQQQQPSGGDVDASATAKQHQLLESHAFAGENARSAAALAPAGLRSTEVVTTRLTKLFVVRVRDDGLSLSCRARQTANDVGSTAVGDRVSMVTETTTAELTLNVSCKLHCFNRPVISVCLSYVLAGDKAAKPLTHIPCNIS